MSFILDALRKSDQTRQAGALPIAPSNTPNAPMLPIAAAIIAPEMPGASSSSSRWRWPAVIALPCIVLLMGWWKPWSSTPNATTTLPQQPQVIATAPPAPPAAHEKPTPAPAQPTPPATVKTPLKASPIHTPSIPHAAPAPTREASEVSTSIIAGSENELPPNLLAELPKISVAAHSYSQKPKASFIFANDRMLHEGENLASGLRLERITPDGMIFDYKGSRFRRSLQP